MATRYTIFDLGLDAVMNKPLDLASFNTDTEQTNVGAMAMTIPSSARAENITSGELPQTIFYAKKSFSDTTNGFRQGLDPTDGLYKWIIGNGTNRIDWNVTTTNALTVIGAVSASTIDIGGADATSFHVDVDGNMWLGAATFATAPASISNAGAGTFTNITITGASSSVAGDAVVGGWTATSSSLSNTSGGNTVTFSTGTTAIISGPTGSPTFSVTAAGAMTSTSGLIGAWTINSSTLTGGNATLDPLGDLTLGTGNNLVRLSSTDATYRLWAGHATASAAPFSVTQGGILRATNASEIVLTVADLGNVVGLIVTQNDTTNNPVAVSITQNSTGDILNIFDGAVETFTVLGTGRVGIYQGTPTAVFEIVQTSALTTGNTLLVSRDLTAASTDSAVVNIIQDHASDDQSALNIRQDGSSDGITISTASTTGYGIAINATSLTTGSAGRFYSNATDVSTRNLVEIINDNTLATGVVALRIQQDSTGNIFQAFDGTTQIFTIADGGSVYINDTSNANIALGLTINMGTNDNGFFVGKSSDVAHGMTDFYETDTFGSLEKYDGNGGGLLICGITDANVAVARVLTLRAYSGIAADTTKTTAAEGLINFRAALVSGASRASPGTNANLVTITDDANGLAKFIFDQEGDLYCLDGTNTVIVSDAWTQIGETVLGSAATSISVASLPARKDIRIHIQINGSSGAHAVWLRFNNDSAANYVYESFTDGTSGSSTGGAAQVILFNTVAGVTFTDAYCVLDVLNETARQKLITGHATWTADTGSTGVQIAQIGGKWDNEAAQINRVDIISSDADTFAAGSRVTIYGKRN